MIYTSFQKMVKIFKDLLPTVINEACEEYDVCRRTKIPPPWPKLSLPKAQSINEVISMDLKDIKTKGYILYMLDEFLRFVKAKIVKDKQPKTILRTFWDIWVLEDPEISSKRIFTERGCELRNHNMKEVASKYDVKLCVTARHSPWNNGANDATTLLSIRQLKNFLKRW